MANIKVAVRVRPISARELNFTGSDVVVRSDVNEISLTNLKVSSSKAGDSRERTRKYGFNYCFDSSDPESENFVDQASIYKTLGHTVLDAVFSGYTSCLVAYGQSASGKTYTMMGTKDDPGLTPRLCEGLFTRIEEERKNDRNYCVSVSYLEIYNERVRDLLKPFSSTSGLRVREHPRLGPYVQGLTHHVVHTLGTLMSYVEEGTRARKTASTLQNPSSSRSHALLTIAVAPESQGVVNGVTPCSSTRRNEISPRGASKLRLVDLAGSESAATCSGVHRLKVSLQEGANINKSLVALGNVISALAERGSTGSGPGRRFIPYRDSSLTWLLKDALGGNATTIMLATISPASGSYNETAHTLRFAQRAQSVVNRPVVNEDPVARVIRELRAEVARLKSLLLEKNIEPDVKALCPCQQDQSRNCGDRKEGTETECTRQSIRQAIEGKLRGRLFDASAEGEEGAKSLVPLRRSNSSDSVTTCEVGSTSKKFGSLELLAKGDRVGRSYNRAKVTELNHEEDEIGEIHESVFVDIPTLVAVLIKPDDNLQEACVQIEEICSDEVAEESIDVGFIETVNDNDDGSSSASYHASGDNEADVYRNSVESRAQLNFKPKGKPKFRKQDSVDFISISLPSNLHTSKRFGSVETIQKRRDPIFSLERSHTNLEKRSTGSDKAKKLNNIREIEDRRTASRNNLLQRKGSNDSDKGPKESDAQNGIKSRNSARKSSFENLKRKTSKDSSSSSSKDEQISISSSTKEKLFGRKGSLEQEPPAIRNHTPIQRTKRAEIVAAVTERLYSSRKQAEDASGMPSPPEISEVKSIAKMKLQEISRKMLGKRRRVCVDTQTDCSRTVRMKDTASLTENPQVVCQDVGVLTDHHVVSEYPRDQTTTVRRVKETATSTDRPKTNIARCRDVGTLANDLEDYDYEIHSPRNDSGILSDDTQNYAESNLSSTEVSDLCQEADRRVAYAESSTNTSMFSSCRSFAVQTPRPEENAQQVTETKAPVCLRQCCNASQGSRNHPSSNNSEKNVISISLPDTINITIESRNTLEPRIAVTDSDSVQGSKKPSTKDGEVQTNQWNDLSDEIVHTKDQARSTLSQTDSRVFRIENIFQDPNNAANSTEVDRIMEGSRIRNSITFRNSLGTSYVSQPKENELTSAVNGLHGEGFIRDGLITEAFITRKRNFNFGGSPGSAVYQDSWRNWQVPGSSANVKSNDYRDRVMASCWQQPILENNCTFRDTQMDDDSIKNEETDACTVLNGDMDHDHGFSDDSLDYNENNVCSETIEMLKAKQSMERENYCPPDVVAHTKKECPASTAEPEKNEFDNEFDDSQVEFPKRNPTESIDDAKVHDYKSLILGRPCYNYEGVNDDSDASSNSVSSSGKKKVSFSDTNVSERPSSSKQASTPTLKSIIKKWRKKNISEPLNAVQSSNDETDDSQQGEKIGLFSGNVWKEDVQSTSSEETREDQDSVESKGNFKQNRKKVKFSVEELSESDNYENAEYEDEEDEEILSCAGRNILEEYLSEAVTFMRNLNSINEYVNGTSTLERHPPFPSRGRQGKRGTRRRSCSSGRNRDYVEFLSRKVSPMEDIDYPVENDDIVASTESYDRCLRGIQRLEDCFQRVDKHNELLREKYGVNCQSAGARLGLADPSADDRVPMAKNDLGALRGTNIPLDKRFDVAEQKGGDDDDLEKKIFDQLMNVANSIRYRGSSKRETHPPRVSDSGPRSPGGYSKVREKHSSKTGDPFCRDITASLSLGETSDINDDEQAFTTYEVTGNLSFGKTCTPEESDDNHDSAMDEDFSPIRRFNHSPWPANPDRRTSRTAGHDDSTKYRAIDNDSDCSEGMYNARGNLSMHRVSTDSIREKFEGRDDYFRRIKDGGWRTSACSKDHSRIESSPSETVHFREKLKYPGSPRARLLELLRERRRIVECSRGASAS